jgi:hypothetical protein
MLTPTQRQRIEDLGRLIPGLVAKNTVDGKLQSELFWASFSRVADSILSDVQAADRDAAVQLVRNHLFACDLDPAEYRNSR